MAESTDSECADEGQSADNVEVNGGFAAAVAGTGARVIDHMKQALRGDVDLLRNLHARQEEVARRRLQERRLRVDLERRLREELVSADHAAVVEAIGPPLSSPSPFQSCFGSPYERTRLAI